MTHQGQQEHLLSLQQPQAQAVSSGPAEVPIDLPAGLLQQQELEQEGQRHAGPCQLGNAASLAAEGGVEAVVMPVVPAAAESRRTEQIAWPPASCAVLPQTVQQPSSGSDAVPRMAALGMADVSTAEGAANLLSISPEVPELEHGTLQTLPASSDSSRHCTATCEEPPCVGKIGRAHV